MKPDSLDTRIVAAMIAQPKVSTLALCRTLGVARATVQSRLDKLEQSGAVSFVPRPQPASFGYLVSAFVSLEIVQTEMESPVPAELETIPEVLEVYSVSGVADLLIKVVARSNEDLERVILRILTLPAVTRTSTSIVLRTHLADRTYAAFASASLNA
jgi:DNA-binding Lrp family transcriptional regulator